jgi:E3 SUMO-protein ligase PIAS1
MLVQATSVDKLVENLQANSRRSNYEIKQKSMFEFIFVYFRSDRICPPVLESMSDDDDIQAGPQKMSLKCPVRKHHSLTTTAFDPLI